MSTVSVRRALIPLAAVGCLWLTACGSNDEGLDPSADDSISSPYPTALDSETLTATTPTPSDSVTPTIDADTLITLDQPTAGATVSGSFKASGKANSPEANVPWSIKDAAGNEVKNGHFTALGWMDKLYPYHGTVKLDGIEPGEYTFEVAIDDPSDGEGKAPQVVDVPITVQ